MILDVDLREESLPPMEVEPSIDTDSDFPLSLDGLLLGSPKERPTYRDPGLYLAGALLVATNVLLLRGYRVPFLGAALGWWLIMVYPAYLLCTTRIWKRISGAERVVISVGAVLLALIVGGLLFDVVLPHLGVPRPLSLNPVLLQVDAMNIGLVAWRVHRGSDGNSWLKRLRSIRALEWRVLGFSTACVLVVIAGAIRLNNGSGDAVALVGLGGVAATFAILLWWRDKLRDWAVSGATYLLSLSLLLATSLRGWYVTGHDIQQEFRVFQLAKDNGVWDIGTFRTAYNACLSITILPTEIWQLVRVDDPYVFKVFFQLLFAMCPVLVYLLARRHWSKQIAILSVVYFVGFPGFFTDMPFLNRQEIAFLFVGLAYLATTMRHWSVGRRRIGLGVWALGVGLSHYSTMYVFVGTMAVAWAAEHGLGVLSWVRRHKRRPAHATGGAWAETSKTVTLGIVIAAGLMAFLWSGVVTRTGASVVTTAENAFPPVFHTSGGGHSVDGTYGLLSGKSPTSAQLLEQYQKLALHQRKEVLPGTYLPLSKVTSPRVRALDTPSLPPTKLGRLLADVHIPVATVNGLVRGLASRGEQIFIGVGLLGLFFLRRWRRHVGRDTYCLAVGAVVMVAAVTVLPGLSVSYGILRAFEQALIITAPFLVIGSFAVFRFLGRVWAARAGTVLALVFFVSTIGLMPQLLGGYPAQLNLNNSGVYYDDYYTQPQEVTAVQWLGKQPGTLPAGVQAEDYTDRYYFTAPNAINPDQTVTDIYPTLIRKTSWVVLGYPTVTTGVASVPISGDLVPYRYPTSVLNDNKDLVYDDGGTVIYK